MARLKTAKQRITDYLKALGKDASEIKDVFDELDLADADLDKFADAADKNKQWIEWYNQATPAIHEIITERDTLKQRVQKLEAAGLTFSDAQAAAQMSMNQQPNTTATPQNWDPKQFESGVLKATNTVIKDVARATVRHLKEFDEDLDIDAVEKLQGEKGVPFDVAYGLYVAPRREEKSKKDYEEKLQKGIQEGVQAALSKQGIRRTRKRTDDIEPAPLDKPAPADADLKEAFLRDLEEDVTH